MRKQKKKRSETNESSRKGRTRRETARSPENALFLREENARVTRKKNDPEGFPFALTSQMPPC